MQSHQLFSPKEKAFTNDVRNPHLEPSTIMIIGTGGTITGSADSATSATYAPSQLNVAKLLESMPSIEKFNKDIAAVDLFRVNSEDMTINHWLHLAKTINKVLASVNVKGVVITHGTDTLEETAYFLDLVVKSDKPVVLVAAMRAATSLSADGPLNLFNALAVVNAKESYGQGVMVVMNDLIFDARDVTKCHTTKVNTFQSLNSGPIGQVHYGAVTFNHRVTRKHTLETSFDIMNVDVLPTVEIVYGYAGDNGNVLKAVIKQKPDGIVIAGVGDGSLSAADRALLKYAKEGGIQIVRSSRTGSGKVTETSDDEEYSLLAADNLNPQKARILLMLSLMQSRQLNDLKRNFQLY